MSRCHIVAGNDEYRIRVYSLNVGLFMDRENGHRKVNGKERKGRIGAE